MSFVARPRLRGLVTLAAMAAALAAVSPAAAGSAAPRTWYVAPSGTGGGSCATPDHHVIQDAVDASTQGDTIVVCPGVYEGNVNISTHAHDGLTLRASTPLGATIATGIGSGGYGALVTVTAVNDVTIKDLRLLASTGAGCRFTARHVTIDLGALRASIIGNRMSTEGDVTLQGPCTVGQGILVNGGSSATIRDNVIRDWVSDAIAVGHDSNVTIARNKLQFLHAGWTHGSQPSAATGIIVQGATVRISGNTISGRKGAGLASDAAPILDDAILITNAAQRATVKGNVVTRNVRGIEIAGGTGFLIKGNDARGNLRRDCLDHTTGTGTKGTANTWIANLGRPGASRPKGICLLP
ncbi:MAG: right-handed parallel beta-helix repeat-containing protein [Chloroflexota bacterium]